MLLIMLVFIILAEAGNVPADHLDQASLLFQLRTSGHLSAVSVSDHNLNARAYGDSGKETNKDDHFLKNGLPGQPTLKENFNQYAGYIEVDESTGRSLFYYFVESSVNCSSKPLILWLNGGPGCSSVGLGAFTEIGPFGVNPDGETLFAREFAWNQVANLIFLESPAGVGFSYSNTSSDYRFLGDQMTADDTYVFLIKWFKRYTEYQGRDFFLVGESYAGHFIPELADLILEKKKDKASTHMINLQGIMIGNGLIDDLSDTRGSIDYLWTHALLSDETREFALQSCSTGSLYETRVCGIAISKIINEIGGVNFNFFDIYGPVCNPSLINHTPTGRPDPCDISYASSYLNRPQVQAALNANTTKLPYPWEACSDHMPFRWNDSVLSMLHIYKRLMAHGLRILLYSGDVDAVVPATATRYAIARMRLKVINPWHWWSISNTLEVAGYKVVYDGLTYATVRGAGHEVAVTHPDSIFYLLNDFLGSLP